MDKVTVAAAHFLFQMESTLENKGCDGTTNTKTELGIRSPTQSVRSITITFHNAAHVVGGPISLRFVLVPFSK